MPRLLKLFFISLAISLLLIQPSRGEEKSSFFKNINFYQDLATYIQKEKSNLFSREFQPLNLAIGEAVFLNILDLILSGSCLWLTMLILFRRVHFNVKAYLWFVFAYNICWFTVLALFRGAWKTLSFLVISQQADLETVILDKFCTLIVLSSVIIFIWLLARSFSLQFLGALETFFTLHLIYLAFILVFFQVFINFDHKLVRLARENLGLRPIMRSYFSEINKVSYGSNLFLLDKVKVFRL